MPVGLHSLRLNWVRVLAVVGQSFLLSAALEAPGALMPTFLLAAGVAAAATASIFALMHLRRQDALDERTLFMHLLIDLMVLAYMLALSGGPDNPFLDAYFLPIAVAAATLSARYAWWVAAAALGRYSVVMLVHLPLPASAALNRALVASEWVSHVALTLVATYFLLRITRELRERERQLRDAREAASRAECAIAVGSIAAGAVHELSAPLMTVSVLVEELRSGTYDPAQARRDLGLMALGIAECRKSLDILRRASGGWQPSSDRIPVGWFVQDVLSRFQSMQPGLEVTTTIDTRPDEPMVTADVALQQAVINLLVNAAAVSPQDVGLSVGWNDEELTISVHDRGPGVAPSILTQLGHAFVSTKPDGSGMGLFLTQITTKRLRGRFQIKNAKDRGAVAEIVLPLNHPEPGGN